jgi:hypothetical protein
MHIRNTYKLFYLNLAFLCSFKFCIPLLIETFYTQKNLIKSYFQCKEYMEPCKPGEIIPTGETL